MKKKNTSTDITAHDSMGLYYAGTSYIPLLEYLNFLTATCSKPYDQEQINFKLWERSYSRLGLPNSLPSKT